MIQNILAILIVLAAAVGMWLIIRRQRRTDCSKGCNGCPLVHSCSKIGLILGFICMSVPSFAHLHGIVYDDKGEPLVGANVWWAETTVGTTTDADGIFEIEHKSSGTVISKISVL